MTGFLMLQEYYKTKKEAEPSGVIPLPSGQLCPTNAATQSGTLA